MTDRRRSVACASLLALATSACTGVLAPSSYQANAQLLSLAPVVVFQGSRGPLSYQTAVGRDGQRYLPTKRVRVEACQRGIQVPILSVITWAAGADAGRGPGSLSGGWGDGGYQAALDALRDELPRGAVLYDVQADLHHRSYLSVYRIQCVRIDAGVLVPTTLAPTG